jgi:hypothetical protein
MAIFAVSPFAGPALAPIISGFIHVRGVPWQWMFWTLTLFSGACIAAIVRPPHRLWNTSLTSPAVVPPAGNLRPLPAGEESRAITERDRREAVLCATRTAPAGANARRSSPRAAAEPFGHALYGARCGALCRCTQSCPLTRPESSSRPYSSGLCTGTHEFLFGASPHIIDSCLYLGFESYPLIFRGNHGKARHINNRVLNVCQGGTRAS